MRIGCVETLVNNKNGRGSYGVSERGVVNLVEKCVRVETCVNTVVSSPGESCVRVETLASS